MKLLYLSSKNAITGNASNFEVQLTSTLSIEEGGRFRIDQLRLGVAFMLVNENNRNLYFLEGPNELRHAKLEIGQYTSESLAATLAFVMNAAAGMQGRVTCQYSLVSASTVLTYSPPANGPFWGLSFVADAALQQNWADIASFPGINLHTPKSFTSVLGGYVTTKSGTNSVLTFRFISMQPYDVLYLCSKRLGNTSIQGPRGSCDTLMQIVINQPFGSVQEASMPQDVWNSCDRLTCHRLDFQIQDASGNDVDMSLGGDVSFVLAIDDGKS